MTEKMLAIGINNVVEFLKENFTPVDNVPENVEKRDVICMEARASLLIEANCTSERFPAFMKCGKYTDSGWVYPLSPKFIAEFDHASTSRALALQLKWVFDEFHISNNQIAIDEDGEITNRWKLFVLKDKQSGQISIAKISPQLFNIFDANKEFEEDLKLLQRYFYEKYKCLYHLCLNVSPYKNPEQVCRFFGNSPDVFSKLKLSGMWPDRFFESETLDVDECVEPNCTEEQQVQSYFERLIPCSMVSKKRSTLPSKYYENWFCQTFPFRDQYGEIRMQLIKLYDQETQSKLLIPVTSWMRGNFPYNQLFCVPVPEDRQPLYNLDLLLAPDTQIIILTDSVELADSNQRHAPDGVVFTSFICSPGRYDQVDWEPLKGKAVYYLIANHSDIILETATLKARELQNYFIEEELAIALSFIVVAINYNPASQKRPREFKNVDDILTRYRENRPQINQESVRMINPGEEFDEFCQKAEAFINAKPLEFWQDASSSQEQQRVIEKESNKRKAPAYLLRPFLLRGEVSMLYASKSTGKSVLALSMAAVVVGANRPLFYEKWWTAPKPQDYPLNKVLYLDFENGEEEIRQRKIDFAYPYWPQDKEARDKCEANLIITDMKEVAAGIDYSSPENWQKIIDLLEKAKDQGIKGQPVDLLVIDTLTKFTKKPYTSNLNISDFINKLRSQNLAVLVVHHEGSDGEVRGWKCGLDDVYFNLRLYRPEVKREKGVSEAGEFTVKTLEVPLTLAYHNARSSIENNPAFEIRFDGKWVEYDRDSDPDDKERSEERRREEFKRIVKHYESKRLENQDIFPILGISKDTYYKLKK